MFVMRKQLVLKSTIDNQYFVHQLVVYNNLFSTQIPQEMLRFKKQEVLPELSVTLL